MGHKIVNIALPVVNEIIDDILTTAAPFSHHGSVGMSETRDRLVTFVVSRLPARYMALAESDGEGDPVPMGCYSSDQHQHIRQLVHIGIRKALTPRPAAPCREKTYPSSWFG